MVQYLHFRILKFPLKHVAVEKLDLLSSDSETLGLCCASVSGCFHSRRDCLGSGRGYNFNLQGFAEMYQKEQYPDPVAIDVAPNIS